MGKQQPETRNNIGNRASGNRRFTKNSYYYLTALLFWIVPLIIVSIMVIHDPTKRTVTPVFHHAVEHWLASEPLYANFSAFHYLPQFALLFMPFHLMPTPFGDVVWRSVSVALLLGGVGGLVKCIKSIDHGHIFFYSSFLAIGPCFGALRNGQTNLAFGALSLITAALLANSRWWLASICLVVLLTLKPLGIVLLLLAPMVYRQLLWRLSILLAIFISLPLIFADLGYLLSQYRAAAEHLYSVSAITERRFADFNGLLRAIGVFLPEMLSQLIRVVAGLYVLVLWLTESIRISGFQRALLLILLANTYLMLFNPMTEINSYAIIAPTLAICAVYYLTIEQQIKLGWGLVLIILSITIFPELFRPVDRNFGLWWNPLMMILLSLLLTVKILFHQGLFRMTFKTEPALSNDKS